MQPGPAERVEGHVEIPADRLHLGPRGLELVADDSANVSVDRTRVTDVQIANRLTVSSFGSVHGCLEPRSLGTGLAIRRALTEWGPGVHRRSLLVVDIVERAFAVDMAPGIGRRC